MTKSFRKGSVSLRYNEEIVSNFVGERKQILRFSATALLLTFLMQSDIFIVQHLFVGDRAGNYGAVSVLAKFLFFLCSALETVYYPQLAKKTSDEVAIHQFRNYALLFMLCVLSALGVV
jgi:O-antigen/teichoic acid export membrane protein